jgi:cytochrome c553
MRNIILASIVLSFLMIGCSDNSKKNTEVKVGQQSEQATKKPIIKKTSTVTKKSENLTNETKEVGAKVATVVKQSTQIIIKKTKELTKKVKNNEIVQKVVKKVSEGTKALVNVAAESGMMAGGSGMSANATSQKKDSLKEPKLFTKCAGCHGAKAQKHALGVSKIIAGWSAKKIENALHGYKNGTFGGVMKGVMKGQASSLSDNDMKVLANYISKL